MHVPAGRPVPLSLDRLDESVRQGERRLKLTPKAFAVLCHLIEQPGRLVTKEDLLATIWPDSVVTDASLTTCIREIRRALDDDPAAPVYIQTVHRRGYRYTGSINRSVTDGPAERDGVASSVRLVGREVELDALDRHLRHAARGERRVIFVTGEPGIGKTAVVEAFVKHAARDGDVRVACGQCVEHYGAGEAYLPWLEVLNQFARDYGG